MKAAMNRSIAIALGLLGSLGCVGAAQAGCSAWTNAMDIAYAIGGQGVIIDTDLSDGSWFVFSANTQDSIIAFMIDEDGVKELDSSGEDENGTLTLTDDDGNVCTISCDPNGGVSVTIAGASFTTLTWDVTVAGGVNMPGNTCGCSKGAGAPTQNVVCNALNCLNSAACRPGTPTPAGYCQPGTTP